MVTLQEPWNPWPEMVPYLAGAMESLARDGDLAGAMESLARDGDLAGVMESLARDDALPCRSRGILGQR